MDTCSSLEAGVYLFIWFYILYFLFYLVFGCFPGFRWWSYCVWMWFARFINNSIAECSACSQNICNAWPFSQFVGYFTSTACCLDYLSFFWTAKIYTSIFFYVLSNREYFSIVVRNVWSNNSMGGINCLYAYCPKEMEQWRNCNMFSHYQAKNMVA